MIRQQIQRLLLSALVATVALSGLAASTATAAEPTITFQGGGWGHGIGMSQYGAYGRAQAGHSYQDILGFYYDGSGIGDIDNHLGSASDDVDVRVDVRSSVAVSKPNGVTGWRVWLRAGGVTIGSSWRPVTATWNGSRWIANWTHPDTGVTKDLCAGKPECANSALRFFLDPDERVVLEEYENGPNLGEFRGGKIILHPADVATSKGPTGLCGDAGADQFCVIHGDLTMQQYLYGLAEVPSSWPGEALKAQAVAGRSYAATRIQQRSSSPSWVAPFDLYESVQDQAYSGWAKWSTCSTTAWCDAVNATDDQVVVHGGGIAETFYSSSNGGYTATPPDVWASGSSLPYLKAKPDPYDTNSANPNAAREYVYTVAQVSKWLNDYDDPITGTQLHVGTVRSIDIQAPPSGRITFAKVTIHGTSKSTVVEGRVVDGKVVGGDYGFRFYTALEKGCAATPNCVFPRSTNLRLVSGLPFSDVRFGDYYYEPVKWLTLEGLTTGVAPGLFGPDQSNTRAQLATFLWRFAGEPKAGGKTPFGDVVPDSFYEDAVAWMYSQGITTGTSPTRFSPDGTVTRAQAAAFLWRFAGSPTSDAPIAFTDVASGRYYSEAVRWMVENNITTGTTPTTFSPDDVLTRAQIATFLWRLAGAPNAFAKGTPLPPNMR